MTRVIPRYDLYGDQAQPGWHNSFDFEWIPQRSRPYNWNIEPHVHESFIQVLYLTQGSVEMALNNAQLQLSAPCLLVVPAQNVHGFHFSPDVDGPVVTAAQRPLESLAGILMPELLQTLRKPVAINLTGSDREAEALLPLFLAIERESRMHAMGQVAAGMSLLMALLVHVARISIAHPVPSPARGLRKNQQIDKYRSLVDENFKSRLPLSDYAQQLGVTTGQLSRLCREVLGISGLDVINARIIHEAQRDLVYGTSSIKQQADLLGFKDEAYFCRFFRKHTGLTPLQFRSQALESMLEPAHQPRHPEARDGEVPG